VFEELTVAIENLDVPAERDSLVAAIALRDRLDARIAEAVGAFEADGVWAVDASASMTAWLRAHARMTRRAAQRLWSVSKRMRALPVCARAYSEGVLSGGQIEAIVALLDDETVEVFAAQEAELVPYLAPLTVAGVSRAMGAWITRARPEPTEPKDPDRSLHLSRTLDDRWVLDGALDPEGGPFWPPPCAWPCPVPPTPRAAPPPAGPTPWSTSAGSSSTTSTASPVVVTAPISTWWSASRICKRAGGAGWSTVPAWTGPASPGCCATARCTGW